jgi:hypothetical protein
MKAVVHQKAALWTLVHPQKSSLSWNLKKPLNLKPVSLKVKKKILSVNHSFVECRFLAVGHSKGIAYIK